MKKFAGIVGAVIAAVGVAIAATQRKSQMQLFADTLVATNEKMMETLRDVMTPPPAYDMPQSSIPISPELIEAARQGAGGDPSKLPWYLGGSAGDISPDDDLDPINLDAPLDDLDRVQPMQAGSIGPVLSGGVFDEPIVEQDGYNRVVSYDAGENPLKDIGLTPPRTNLITGDIE